MSHGSPVSALSLVSQRGVVIFRAQNDFMNNLQKELILRLGALSGRPSTSGIQIDPIFVSVLPTLPSTRPSAPSLLTQMVVFGSLYVGIATAVHGSIVILAAQLRP